MYTLGINAYHADSAAVLIKDGSVLAAFEEERFTRRKHECGFPYGAIDACLAASGITIRDVKHIAINTSNKSLRLARVRHAIKHLISPTLILQKLSQRLKRTSVQASIHSHYGEVDCKIHYIDHHTAHLYSAYYPSGLQSALVLSVDGFGDFASTAVAIARDGRLNIIKKIHFPHSLGVLYTTITQFLGFRSYGDEYKVMGLAPYGKPIYASKIRELVKIFADGRFEFNLRYFKHHKLALNHQWESGSPKCGDHLTDALINYLGPSRRYNEPITKFHMDMASSIQLVFEEALFNLINTVEVDESITSVCLAGGCAANSVANGKIPLNTRYNNVYVQPSPGDAGGAMGAAMYVEHNVLGNKIKPLRNAYLGPLPNYSENLKKVLDTCADDVADSHPFRILDLRHAEDPIQKVISLTSEALTRGCVLGWCLGDMEWGPRALGSRSILADPTNPKMKDIINLKIKKRESFRPFAPAVLSEHHRDWFHNPSENDVPFMMQVCQVLESKSPLIPAVTHVDGSARIQTVSKDDSPTFYRLIQSFYKKTSVPILLNTSFNENEPIVYTCEEAYNCFKRTELDMVIFEGVIIYRETPETVKLFG